MNGNKVASALNKARRERNTLPESITVSTMGSQFSSKCLHVWAVENGEHLDHPAWTTCTENGFIESFNGRLRGRVLKCGTTVLASRCTEQTSLLA